MALNELADYLAVGARMGTDTSELTHAPWSKVCSELKAWELGCWQQEWQTRADCKQTRSYLWSVQNDLLPALIGLGNQDYSLLIQLISGHDNLNKHQFRLNKAPSGNCRGCKRSPETLPHLMWECPNFSGKFTKNTNGDPESVGAWLSKCLRIFKSEVLPTLR